jgi:electron transport complex protein RnfG
VKTGFLKVNILGMLKLGFILAIFAVAACVMLAFVYTGTKTIIEQQDEKNLQAALRELFPDADNFKSIDNIISPDPAVTIVNAYSAIINNNIIGAATTVTRASYSGPIKTMVGVNTEGLITRVKILEHSDTPGLGANAASSSYFVDRTRGITFYGQFAGKKVTDAFTVNNDIAAITASTVTSVAVSNSVKAAALAVNAWLAGTEPDIISSATRKAE